METLHVVAQLFNVLDLCYVLCVGTIFVGVNFHFDFLQVLQNLVIVRD
jgi:hypothetical protein